jgi:LAO/AO transport system ATPase
VLISKIGLDGHDRGAKLIVRNLRDAGMEVIYTGLWQTPASTVQAAVQEDVDVVGVSLLSAAHMTIMPELQRLCRAAHVPDLPLMVGGIIPEEDGQKLRENGIDEVFNPGTPMQAIIEATTRLARRRQEQRAGQTDVPDINTMHGLARAMTWITQGRGDQLPTLPDPQVRSLCVGVTGAPGVGKSTFIGKLATALQDRDVRVGVIAVDPTSPLTGGSVLGDRLRMMSAEPRDTLFVRSLSSAGTPGGLAPHLEDIATLLRRAGYQVVLVETVGAGQNDTQVRALTDEVLLLLMPGAGDAIQFAKAGVVEIATGFVVNKADLAGADATIRQLRESLGDERPVWGVSSIRSQGLDPLCDWIQEHCPSG